MVFSIQRSHEEDYTYDIEKDIAKYRCRILSRTEDHASLKVIPLSTKLRFTCRTERQQSEKKTRAATGHGSQLVSNCLHEPNFDKKQNMNLVEFYSVSGRDCGKRNRYLFEKWKL